MTEAFSSDEVFRIAEQIEFNGVEFYSAAAGRAADQQARDLLASLADMERQHQRIFASMRANLAATGFNPDPEGEAMQYLRALAGSRVFDIAAGRSLSGTESLAEVLQLAVRAEKESVTFYVGILSMLDSQRDRELVNRIIAEEMSHVTLLSGHLARVSSGKETWSNAQ